MPSITSWARLEPQNVRGDVDAGVAARVHDPLWLLARQWQVGEFQGEDGGTPIVARWRAQVAQLTRCQLGPVEPNTRIDAPRFDAATTPLEIFVERRTPQASTGDPSTAKGLRLAVENGQHFLRLLDDQPTSADYGPAFVSTYAVVAPSQQELDALDPATRAFADLAIDRALDGRRLRAALTSAGPIPHIDPTLGVEPGDHAEVVEACRLWLAWSAALLSLPDEDAHAWRPERLEYAFSVATRLADDAFGERTLSAAEYTDGTVDWHSFDLNGEVSMGTADDEPGELVARTVIPAPVTFRGMPAARFWEFEDALIDFGSLKPGATDLAQLLMIETLTGFGNDWYVIPIELPVGSLVESRSLVVTDTFGVQTLLRPNGDHALQPRAHWSVFQLAMPVDPEEPAAVTITNLFFLPATLVQPHEGPPLEEIMLLRDELANMAWAIERRLESPLEVGLDAGGDAPVVEPAVPDSPLDVPVYQLASSVPPHWIPLLPTRVSDTEVRLARAELLDVDGSRRVVRARSQILTDTDETGAQLLIHEEEVPREGAIVRRSYQAARWYDGQLFVWMGKRKSIGRGEGSSGLRFDGLRE
jgi:hypothetical protein